MYIYTYGTAVLVVADEILLSLLSVSERQQQPVRRVLLPCELF